MEQNSSKTKQPIHTCSIDLLQKGQGNSMGLFTTNGTRKRGCPYAKKKKEKEKKTLYTYFIAYIKINSKWISKLKNINYKSAGRKHLRP